MCRALVLRSPLVDVGQTAADAVEAEAAAEGLEALWARALAELSADLLALVAHARAVGLYGEEAEEAEDAAAAPAGDTELSRLRGLQFRESCAQALASHLRAAGHRSALIAEWAGEDERRVRPRLA
jgi:hypothetical protein